MLCKTTVSYEQLHLSAVQLLSNYKTEQVKYDDSRYFAMFRPYTNNVAYEKWAECIGQIAESIQRLHLPTLDNTIKNKFTQILEQAFAFVIKQLYDANEQSSVLMQCCLCALKKNSSNLAEIVKNDNYDELLNHLEWVCSAKNEAQLYKGMINDELIKEIRRNSNRNGYEFVEIPKLQKTLRLKDLMNNELRPSIIPQTTGSVENKLQMI